MTDLSGGAAAPADAPVVSEAPISDVASLPPQPLGSQIPPDARADAQPAKPASLDDSIDRAIAKSAEKEATAKAAPEKVAKDPPAKVEPARGEGGKFAPKEPAQDAAQVAAKPATDVKAPEPAKASFTASEAPARFSPDAKERWAETHESVRGETERAIRELTEGHQKYKQAAEKFESLKEFDELATRHGTDLKTALTRYTNMEAMLQKDVVGGLEEICRNVGVSLKDVAAHVLNQPADQQASQSDAKVRQLEAELAQIKQQVGNVTETFQRQQFTATQSEVEKFASDPAHSRFDELADEIAFFLQHKTKDLSEAYSMADRLNPAPAQASNVQPPASSAAAPAPEAQNLKGQKSITGAPSPGLRSPGKPRAIISIDDALDRAVGAVG